MALYIQNSLKYKVVDNIDDVMECISAEICMENRKMSLSVVCVELQHPTLKPLKTV